MPGYDIKSRLRDSAPKAAKYIVAVGAVFLPFDLYFLITEGTIVGAIFFFGFMLLLSYPFYRADGSVYISDSVYRSEMKFIFKYTHEQSIRNWQVLRVSRGNVLKEFLERKLRKPQYLTKLSFLMRHNNPPFDDVRIPEIYFVDDDDPETVVKMIKAIQEATGFDVVFNEEALAQWYPTYQKLCGDLEYKFAEHKALLLA